MLRYVVTGCGRSGTTYTAHLLTAAGLECGHESVFNRWTPGYDTMPDWTEAVGLLGDSSFSATAFLGEIGDDLVKVHLVRPPLDVIRSVVGNRQLASPPAPWVRFLDHHIGILEHPDEIHRAAAYWVRWNEVAASHADVTWRTGQVAAADILDLADRIGLSVDLGQIAAALDLTPTDTNHREAPATGIDLERLGDFAGVIQDDADRYGIPLETATEGGTP